MWHYASYIRYVVRYFGPGWILFRIWYALRKRFTSLIGAPRVFSWDSYSLVSYLKDTSLTHPDTYLNYRRSQAPKFFFSPAQRVAYANCCARWYTDDKTPVTAADRIVEGQFQYFSNTWIPAGLPPDWHTNPFTDQKAPPDRHWMQIDDFAYGDIKTIWEINRFGFVYTLVRAYWCTGDERYPKTFWSLVENWHGENSPYQGPNWKCGQEASLRVMAWCFGLYGFLNSDATTAE